MRCIMKIMLSTVRFDVDNMARYFHFSTLMVNQQFNCMRNAHCSYLLNLENSLLSQSLSHTTQYCTRTLYWLSWYSISSYAALMDLLYSPRGSTDAQIKAHWPLLLAFSAGTACCVPNYSVALGTLGCLHVDDISEVVCCTACASRIFECSRMCIVMHYCNPW